MIETGMDLEFVSKKLELPKELIEEYLKNFNEK